MGLKKFFKGLFKSSGAKETSPTPVAAVKKEQAKAKPSTTTKSAAAAAAAAAAPIEHTVEEVQDIAEIPEIKDQEKTQMIPEEAAAGTTAEAAETTGEDAHDLDSYDFEEVNTQEAEELAKTYKDVSDEASTRIGRDEPFVFGQRKLENEDDVWNHNAWDNVELSDEQIKELETKIQAQKEHPVKDFDKKLVNENPAKYWDLFYKNNKENFFKDRKWLQIEFPCLYEATKADAGEKVILEIGCGAGNSMFPILSQNENPKLRIHGSDFSARAVDLVKNSEHFDEKITSASVWDLANAEGALPEGIEENSVDIAVMIFVFSALSPREWDNALNNLSKILKPGGKILFRDYGRYDLAQVRFKKNRILEDNFYIRGDNTRVYFFTEEELREIFTKKFIENRIGMDRRLIVNRKRQVKMYRCWLQAVFDVPAVEQVEASETAAVAEETSVAAVTEEPVVAEEKEVPAVEETPVVEEPEVTETETVSEEAEPVVEEPAVKETETVSEEQTEEPVVAQEETPAVEEAEPVAEETTDAAAGEEPVAAAEEQEVEPVAAEQPVETAVVSEEAPVAATETTETTEAATEPAETTEEASTEEAKESEETPAAPASAGSNKSSSNSNKKKNNNKKKKKKGKK